MPRTSQPCPIDFKSLISENCHILYNRPVSHFILATRHDPASNSSRPWVSSITTRHGQTMGLPHISGYGATLSESLEELHLASSEALASHVAQKGWDTGLEDDDDTSDEDGDELDDLESISSVRSASTLCKNTKPSKISPNLKLGGPKNIAPAPRPRSKPPILCMPDPASSSLEKDNTLHHPVPAGLPVAIPGCPRPSPPRGIHVTGPVPQAPPLRAPKLTRVTVKAGLQFNYSFVELLPHLWEPVTQAALREYALNKPGARLAGARARVSSIVEGGVRTTLKCALRDLAPLVRGGQGLVEFEVDISDK